MESQSVSLLREARRARRAHHYAQSLALLREACACEPPDPDALFELGFFAHDMRAFERGCAMGHGPCAVHVWEEYKCYLGGHDMDKFAKLAFDARAVAERSDSDYVKLVMDYRRIMRSNSDDDNNIVRRCALQEIPYALAMTRIVDTLHRYHPNPHDIIARGAAAGIAYCQYKMVVDVRPVTNETLTWMKHAAQQNLICAKEEFYRMVLIAPYAIWPPPPAMFFVEHRALAIEYLCEDPIRGVFKQGFAPGNVKTVVSFKKLLPEAVKFRRNDELYAYGRVICHRVDVATHLHASDDMRAVRSSSDAQRAKAIYRHCITRCRAACFAVLVLARRRCRVTVLSRNMATVIARMLWETRGHEWIDE